MLLNRFSRLTFKKPFIRHPLGLMNLSEQVNLCIKNYSKYINREARFFGQMLKKNHAKNKLRVCQVSPSVPTFACEKSPMKVNARRISVLNKLFMGHITDLLAYENYHHNLIEKGVEITKVAVTPNFKNINVFWLSFKYISDIESILCNVAHRMHHELSQLQLMGRVPKIKFVRDNHKEKLLEVENLLLSISSNSKQNGNYVQEENVDFEKSHKIVDVYSLDRDNIIKKMNLAKTETWTKQGKEK